MTRQTTPPKLAKSHKTENFTFSDHIRELRRRIVWVALVFAAASSLAYSYHDQLVNIVMAPLKGGKLVYLTPGGGFSFIFQITLYAGLIAAGPMAMYQIYKFIRPTLPGHAQRGALKVAFFATFLMLLGVGYGYFIAVPAALQFLSTFAGDNIIPNLTADSYLSFFLSYIGGLALLFQLPLLLIFWNWVKPLTPSGLLKSERLVIVFAFIMAALITPTPDVVNQAMIAGPLIALYQIGVFIVLAAYLRRRSASSTKQRIQAATHQQANDQQPVAMNLLSPHPLPAAPLTLVQPTKPAYRPIDGFGKAPTRPLTIPPRPDAAPPRLTPARRPRLSIDGISPA